MEEKVKTLDSLSVAPESGGVLVIVLGKWWSCIGCCGDIGFADIGLSGYLATKGVVTLFLWS